MTTQRVKTFVGGMIAAAVGLAGTAWACSPQATLTAPTTPIAPGETLALSGQVVRLGPAQLRWEGAEGPVLASVAPAGRSFSVDVTVPEAAAGVHYVLLVPSEGAVARAAVEVAASPGVAGPAAGRLQNAWTTSGPRSGDGRMGDPMALGVGLLVAGLVALSAATAGACLRRKRVPVTGERPRG